jgi:hypothetical protein
MRPAGRKGQRIVVRIGGGPCWSGRRGATRRGVTGGLGADLVPTYWSGNAVPSINRRAVRR